MGALLLLLLALGLIGHPIRYAFGRLTPFVGRLDVLQGLVLDVFLGGLLLYVLALLPFHLLTPAVTTGIMAGFGSVSAAIVLRPERVRGLIASIRGVRPRLSFGYSQLESLAPLATVGLFVLILWVVFEPTRAYVLGSVHDTSLHALFTQVIADNGHIPVTLAPYEPTGIVQPLGPHPVFAFATYLFGWSAPLAVFLVTPLFIAMLVPGAYFLGKCITGERSFGFLLAATLGLVASHPVYMTWGGNSFAVAFPWLLVCLGFLVMLLKSDETRFEHFVLLYPFFGYLMALHMSVYLSFVIVGMLCFLVKVAASRSALKNAAIFLGTNFLGVLLIAPFIYRYLAWLAEPGHNVGLPEDVGGFWFVPKTMLLPSASWVIEQISPHKVLQGITWLVVGLGIVALAKSWKTSRELLLPLVLFVGAIPILLTFIATRVDAVDEIVGATTATIAYVALGLIAAYFLRFLIRARGTVFNRRYLPAPVVGLVLAVLILSPYVYYRVAVDPGIIRANYRLYAVATEDDLSVIEWMSENTSPDAVVLTSAFEPGLFIPSLAQRKTIFPYTASQNSVSYQELVSGLGAGNLTAASYDAMKSFGVTHLYVGSKASWWPTVDYKWDHRFFIDNPNFRLANGTGDAYVFEVLYGDPNAVFEDDFEYATLDDGGWQWDASDGAEQLGTSALTLESSGAHHGVQGLRIETEKTDGEFYWTSLTKEVFLGKGVEDSVPVRMDFHLEPVSGFGPQDELMLVVSDKSWEKQVYLQTTPGLFWKPEWQVTLRETSGVRGLDLSELWQEIHGSALPDSFYIQPISFDHDGVVNVAEVDYIRIYRGDGQSPPAESGELFASRNETQTRL